MSIRSDPREAPGAAPESAAHPDQELAPAFYDRSSLPGNYLVMIAGQTEEDFFRYAPDHGFCEYLEGIVYMPSPVSTRHQDIAMFLADLLNGWRWERGTGKVLAGPAVLHLGPGLNPEPDLFVQPEGAPVPEDGMKNRGALLVVEILSPSNEKYDLETKGRHYRAAAIPEVWYVDHRERVLIVDRREGDGYRTLRIEAGRHPCGPLPGFWIDVAWLWADPLPNPRRCLEEILAGGHEG